MTFEIRDAVESDIEKITDIFNQAIPAGDAEWTETFHTVDGRRRWWTERTAAGRPVIVAEQDDAPRTEPGSIVGVASYGDFRDSTRREGFRFTVEHSVYVDRAARLAGVAHLLMDELEFRARAAGLRIMIATIDGRNDVSLRLHAHRGYVETGRLPDIGYTFDTWRDFVIMQLDLWQPPVQQLTTRRHARDATAT